MRINSVLSQVVAGCRLNNQYVSNYSTNSIEKNRHKRNYDTSGNTVHISFRGNPEKNVLQGISVSVEDGYIGLPMYKSGGAGGVAEQLPVALNKSGCDFKHVIPFYSYNNPQGYMKVLVLPDDYNKYDPFTSMPENWFISKPVSTSKAEIAKVLNKQEDRIKFVVQDIPVTDEKLAKKFGYEGKDIKFSQFRELIPTNVSGSVTRMDEYELDKMKSIPYRVYKMVIPRNAATGEVDDKSVLCIHTPDLAKFQKAYTYSPELKDHPHVNLFTRDFGDAAADMLPKLNSTEFNKFNPANILAHCRTGFPITESIINRSQNDPYYRGFIIDDIFHNPMSDYQGSMSNALDFLRYKATAEDYNKLAQMPEFSKLVEIDKHRYNLSKEEAELVDRIIKPFLQHYVDDNGHYNQSITPLIARILNPDNVSVNHVSHTFADEVVKYDDLCKGLTSYFRAAQAVGDKIPGRPNGCNIDGFKLNNPNGDFGRGNGLSKDVSWYTPYDPKADSAEQIVTKKRANTKAFLNIIGEASEKRLESIGDFANTKVDDELNQLLYTKDAIKKDKYVLGGLSKFGEKDILVMGWGRSDPQKGFPIAANGLLKFLQREHIPQEWKKGFKLLLASGSDPWPKNDNGSGDFHLIKDIMYKIQNLENGAYKENFMYGNGGISNRAVACATFGISTSRGEPQGLTCPEILQTGTPCASLNTGGAGEMIITSAENAEKANGFKTPDAFMRNVKDLKWPEGTDLSKLSAGEIDTRRIELASEQVADMFEEMARVYHEQPEIYTKMAKNAGSSKFDWHNNHILNNGRSSLQLYKEDAFQIQKGWEGRNKNPLNRLVGEFGGKFEKLKRVVKHKVDKTIETVKTPSGSKWNKAAVFITLGVTVLMGGGAYIYNRNKKSKAA